MATKTKKEKVKAFLEISGIFEPLFDLTFNAARADISITCPHSDLPPENAKPEEIAAFEERIAATAKKVVEAVKNAAVERLASDFTDNELAGILRFFQSPLWARFAESSECIFENAQEVAVKALEEEMKTFSDKPKNGDPESKDPKKNPNIQ